MEYFYVYDMYGLNNSNPLSNVHTAANIIGVQEFEVWSELLQLLLDKRDRSGRIFKLYFFHYVYEYTI